MNHGNCYINRIVAAYYNLMHKRAVSMDILNLDWFKGNKLDNEPAPFVRRYPNIYLLCRN
jgi:hypothetical protein